MKIPLTLQYDCSVLFLLKLFDWMIFSLMNHSDWTMNLQRCFDWLVFYLMIHLDWIVMPLELQYLDAHTVILSPSVTLPDLKINKFLQSFLFLFLFDLSKYECF